MIELANVLNESLDAAQGDLARRHLIAADHRDRDPRERSARDAGRARSAFRLWDGPGSRNFNLGFRPALSSVR